MDGERFDDLVGQVGWGRLIGSGVMGGDHVLLVENKLRWSSVRLGIFMSQSWGDVQGREWLDSDKDRLNRPINLR